MLKKKKTQTLKVVQAVLGVYSSCKWANAGLQPWPPHAKSWLWKWLWCWEGLGAGEGDDWGEMAGWHHRLNGHEFDWIPGVGDGQGGLACCDLWGRKESDTTDWLNWTFTQRKGFTLQQKISKWMYIYALSRNKIIAVSLFLIYILN